ncbi:hypothetical protein [Streptomyces sp. NPDC086787]|uniref:hypothetical protein n=1 Tax=Streptomyces sp. NPDC086787 TaxID=3365759 RepID=UPI0037FFE9CD
MIRKQPTGRRRLDSPRRVPRRATRPEVMTLTAFLVVASLVTGFLVLNRQDSTTPAGSAKGGDSASAKREEPPWDGKTRIIGDGSTSYTGPQKGTLKPVPLKPGEKPPQFVVFSWDGALQGDDKLFSHYRELAKQYDAHMTFFLTGIYLLPKDKKEVYHPPEHKPGASDIDYPTDEHIRDTLEQLRLAYNEGNDIGTHFNGHFCNTADSGKYWSVDDWKQELEQFYEIVGKWKTTTGYKDIPALPFDFRKEVVGGRAPCLQGQANLLKAIKGYNWRYDASSQGDYQIWPKKKEGVWDFPLQALPNGGVQSLSMDFNFLANQSHGEDTEETAKFPGWQRQTVNTYMDGFNRVYYGSRAPMFIGNHFEEWNGGIYMKAVDQVMKQVCTKKGVKCVSFKELADWMDVQTPQTLTNLRTLDPAQSPDWSAVVK